MAFKNIEQATEQQYEGYQFTDSMDDTYKVTFASDVDVTSITRSKSPTSITKIRTKDIPNLIKCLQAVHDKYAEDNSGF